MPDAKTGSFPFHEGELAVQDQIGVSDRAAIMAEQNLSSELYPEVIDRLQRADLIVGAIGAESGFPSVFFVGGKPGSLVEVESSSKVQLRFDLDLRTEYAATMEEERHVGLVSMCPDTGERARVNGQGQIMGERLAIRVEKTLTNCPRFTPRRVLSGIQADLSIADRGTEPIDRVIRRARSFYLATTGPTGMVDISHRGGAAGFVTLDDSGAVCWPDYTGNALMQTLGNLHLNGRATVVFPDFKFLRAVTLNGHVKMRYDASARGRNTTGILHRFFPDRIVQHFLPRSLRWNA